MSFKDLKTNTGSDKYAQSQKDHSKGKTTIKGANQNKKNDAK